MSQTSAGHRERKKQRTREAIAHAGHELFVERGYDATTLADIAEAAGVSTRTIFAYFPSKEDILFCTTSQMCASLADALAARPAGTDALTTLRDFILDSVDQKTELDRNLGEVIAADETLKSHQRARITELRDILAAAMADDLGAAADDLANPREREALLTCPWPWRVTLSLAERLGLAL